MISLSFPSAMVQIHIVPPQHGTAINVGLPTSRSLSQAPPLNLLEFPNPELSKLLQNHVLT